MRTLARGAAKIKAVEKSFSSVQVVEGDLDDQKLIAHEASEADIVVST